MKYPLGIQTFSDIRKDDYVYVDKTDLVYQLVDSGKFYFLSRPRRFGKSLLLSTFDALFRGAKSLFEGLMIGRTDYSFVEYPVLRLDFSGGTFLDAASFNQYVDTMLMRQAEKYGITLTEGINELKLEELTGKLKQKTGKSVVLLIDEYDKPILNNLNSPFLHDIKQAINAFYSLVKMLDPYWRFVFITGVSKFAKVSVFSGMNNLTDISLEGRFATICGVTQQELETQFNQSIDELAQTQGVERAELITKIKQWYNGYRFEELAQTVYNPYSLLCLFRKQKFTSYWFDTATPTFLIEMMKSHQFELAELQQFEVDESIFFAIEPEDISPEPVLLQSGYLTIVDYHNGWYTLDFPNHEVRYAFNHALVVNYGHNNFKTMRKLQNLVKAIEAGNIDEFINTLKIFFANIPYDITLKQEKYYQSLFYALFTLLDFQIDAEVRTNEGRIDCVLSTAKYIYVIEFKLQGSCEEALNQIIEKQYGLKYQDSLKQVFLLGVAFDQQTRNIGEYVVSDLAPTT